MTSIDKSAEEALEAALKIIERDHSELDARQACAKLVADALRGKIYIRHDAVDHGSRPQW